MSGEEADIDELDAMLADVQAIDTGLPAHMLTAAEAATMDYDEHREPSVHTPSQPWRHTQNRSGKKRRGERFDAMVKRQRVSPRKPVKRMLGVSPKPRALGPMLQPPTRTLYEDPWPVYGPYWHQNLCVLDSVMMALFAASTAHGLDTVIPNYMGSSSGLAMLHPALRALQSLNTGTLHKAWAHIRASMDAIYNPVFASGCFRETEGRTYALGDELSLGSVLECLSTGSGLHTEREEQQVQALLQVRAQQQYYICSKNPREHSDTSIRRARKVMTVSHCIQRFGAHTWLGPPKDLHFLQRDGHTRPAEFTLVGDRLGDLPDDCLCSVVDIGDYFNSLASAGTLGVCPHNCDEPAQEVRHFGTTPGPALLWVTTHVCVYC